MYCEWLSVAQFRNLTPQQLQLSPNKNLFLGQNGQGKTNILEALWLLSRGRSHRTRQDKELIQFGQHHVDVSGRFMPEGVTQSAGDVSHTITYHQQVHPDSMRAQSRWQANGVTVASKSQLVGRIPTVGFFHPDLALLRGAPSHRRDWLDAAMVQARPLLVKTLQRYETVRKQKTELLKTCRFPLSVAQKEQLTLWNDSFIEAAIEVMVARVSYLQRISSTAKTQYGLLAKEKERLTLGLQWCKTQILWCDEGNIKDDATLVNHLTAGLTDALHTRQNEEVARQQCVVGPHRDTLMFAIDDQDATAFASQGQQRSIVLALKLAELHYLTHVQQTAPILVLDDVLAELDAQRQAYLLTQLDARSQVWMTTTHVDTQGPLSDWLSELLACFDVLAGTATLNTQLAPSVDHLSTGLSTSLSIDNPLLSTGGNIR